MAILDGVLLPDQWIGGNSIEGVIVFPEQRSQFDEVSGQRRLISMHVQSFDSYTWFGASPSPSSTSAPVAMAGIMAKNASLRPAMFSRDSARNTSVCSLSHLSVAQSIAARSQTRWHGHTLT